MEESEKLGLTGILLLAIGGFLLLQVFYGIARGSFGAYSVMNFVGILSFLTLGLGLYLIVQSGKSQTNRNR
jgi:hypothetical protein